MLWNELGLSACLPRQVRQVLPHLERSQPPARGPASWPPCAWPGTAPASRAHPRSGTRRSELSVIAGRCRDTPPANIGTLGSDQKSHRQAGRIEPELAKYALILRHSTRFGRTSFQIYLIKTIQFVSVIISKIRNSKRTKTMKKNIATANILRGRET